MNDLLRDNRVRVLPQLLYKYISLCHHRIGYVHARTLLALLLPLVEVAPHGGVAAADPLAHSDPWMLGRGLQGDVEELLLSLVAKARWEFASWFQCKCPAAKS